MAVAAKTRRLWMHMTGSGFRRMSRAIRCGAFGSSPEEEAGYYEGFSNEGLWPLCHIAHTRPIFRASDWDYYQRVNAKFAEVLIDEMRDTEHPVVFVQDITLPCFHG